MSEQTADRSHVFMEGMRDGIPIGLGYFAVSFALGITMRNAGLNAVQGFFTSLLNVASAGEYAGVSMIAVDASYTAVALMTLVANARYFLMSCALSQKFSPDTPMIHRMLVGYSVTDELFGIAIAREGYLEPLYYYGAMLVAVPLWSLGTALGVMAGNILPASLVSALSVALYGMFLAIVVPAAKKDKAVLLFTLLACALSWLCSMMPVIAQVSEGSRTIILTVVLSAAAAYFFPRKEEEA